jgi:hypothetical protein
LRAKCDSEVRRKRIYSPARDEYRIFSCKLRGDDEPAIA